jgi:hypothetical protein
MSGINKQYEGLSPLPPHVAARAAPLLIYFFIFLGTFAFLFVGMDRGFDFYDEGFNLVAAMRVAAGQVPHRDFYVNYGPAQFYVLAGLFHLFGTSIFVERMYDLALRSAIVTVTWGITAVYCRRWLAYTTSIVCAFWLFSSGLPTIAYPIIPVLLLVLCSSALLLPMFLAKIAKKQVVLAGCLTGLAALFRYDVGVVLWVLHLLSIAIALFLRKSGSGRGRAKSPSLLYLYALGITIVVLPPALLYLSVASIQPLLHDVVLYPGKYYVRARRVPFPGLHWRSLENIALYLPIFVAILCLYLVLTPDREAGDGAVCARPPEKMGSFGVAVFFGLIGGVFYFKGLVRISVGQMLLSIVITAITIAALFECTRFARPRMHRLIQGVMMLSIFTATWSALKEVRILDRSHDSVLQEILSPPGPKFLRSETAWCGVPNRLHTGLCFLVDPSHIEAITYLAEHTKPSEHVFIGLFRHDRLAQNDLLTYFVSDRLPATHWAQFDPDLQMRADIQLQMIRELEEQKVRCVILESQFDNIVEPSNDSSKSSGVTLLDEYIRNNYQMVKKSGAITIWSRRIGAT